VIRRLFWMTLGAAVGVSGYRKAAAVARAVSPARARARSRGPSRVARGAGAAADFTRDVREGMALYRLSENRGDSTAGRAGRARSDRGAPTLGRHRDTPDWAVAKARAATQCPDEAKDGH